MRRLALAVGLVLGALGAVRCADDPAVAPLLGSGGVEVELRLAGGTAVGLVAGLVAPAVAACDPVPPGFPEDVRVAVTLRSSTGAVVSRNFDIPAHTERTGLVIEQLVPGSSYRAEVRVTAGGADVFEGESGVFVVLPGARTVITIDLDPLGRRAVLAAGAAVALGDSGVAVPIAIAHSAPLRGLEFELCFDADLLEPLEALAVGSRVAGFRGAGGVPGAPGIYHAILWSPDAAARLAPGRGEVLELRFRFRPGSPAEAASNLVFLSALATDAAGAPPFTVYYFDGQVRR